MKDWLKQRLTPAKQKERRWADFATALEAVWEEFFDPRNSRLESLRSSYEMSDEDIARKIREQGDYLSFENPSKNDRPIVLPWRRLELDYKEYESILSLAIKRHLGNVDNHWLPLFNPKDLPYTANMKPAEDLDTFGEKNIPPEGYYLTSRGVLATNYLSLMQYGYSKAYYQEVVLPILLRTKPLHIVFDGWLYYIYHYIHVWPWEVGYEAESISDYELQFATLASRFDHVDADVRPLDTNTLDFSKDVTRNITPFTFLECRRLDGYIVEGFPESWRIPLDTSVGFYDDNPDPLALVYRETDDALPIEVRSIETAIIPGDKETYFPLPDEEELTFTASSEGPITDTVWPDGPYPLDSVQPLFDEISADFMPLDQPYGGYCNV